MKVKGWGKFSFRCTVQEVYMNSRSAEKSVVLKEGKNERCEKETHHELSSCFKWNL